MSSDIPIEIVKLIIDIVADLEHTSSKQRLRDLRACSLVCTSFVPLCQCHLFAEALVVRSGRSAGLVAQRIANRLNQNVNLSTHVRRLVYVSSYSDTKTDFYATRLGLSEFLRLPRLQYLKLLRGDLSIDFGDPVDEGYGPAILLKCYLNSKTLTTLDLVEVRPVKLHDILSAPNLTSLRLASCEVVSNTCYPLPTTNLRTLEISYVKGDVLSWFRIGTPLETVSFRDTGIHLAGLLAIPKVFPALKRLRVHSMTYFPDNDTRMINQILETTTGLECLVAEACGEYKPPHFPLRVRECVVSNRATLKRLHLYLNVLSSADILWQCVYDVLEGVGGRNVIQEINIELFFNVSIGSFFNIGIASHYYTLSDDILPSLEVWAKLDEFLNEDESTFPCLENVSVHIIVREISRTSPSYVAIDPVQLAELRTAVSHSFRRLTTNPNITFRGWVDVHPVANYRFPTTCMV